MLKKQLLIYGLLINLFAYVAVSCVPVVETKGVTTMQDDWEIAQPKDVGIDERVLAELSDQTTSKEFQNIHSILTIKNGKLVFEEYFQGYEWDWDADQFQGEFTHFDSEMRHPIMSVSKVFTSTLVGIAIEQGLIEGLDESVFTFFPDYSRLIDSQKEDITLKHLITMRSGLQWNVIEIPVSTHNPKNDVLHMNISTDPIGFVLSKPLVAEPGSKWYYSNGDAALIGEVIKLSTGMGLDQFVEKHLFIPLGITDFHWRRYGDSDVVAAGGVLELRPRDMAKLGYLYLNGGYGKESGLFQKIG